MCPSPASRHSLQLSPVTSSLADHDRPGLRLRAGRRSRRSAPSARCRRRRRSRRSRRRCTSNETSRTCSIPRSSSTVRPSTGSSGSAGCAGALVDAQQHLAADHQPRQALLGRARGGQRLDLLAAPQHGDPVGDLGHLVQLVADEDDRLPLLGQAPDDREELVRLLRRQHRGRLVEHEDVGAAVERLQDLDALLLADGDVLRRSRAGRRRGRTASRSRARASRPPRSRAGRRCAPARSRARCSRRPSSPGSA